MEGEERLRREGPGRPEERSKHRGLVEEEIGIGGGGVEVAGGDPRLRTTGRTGRRREPTTSVVRFRWTLRPPPR